MEDNLYIVELTPDEFHELLSEYENFVEWCRESMPHGQKELAERVLKKLHEADATHVCIDEVEATTQEFPVNSICREDLKEAGFTDEQIALVTDQDMQAIANKMADWYDEFGFWDDLSAVTAALLEEKEHPDGPPRLP